MSKILLILLLLSFYCLLFFQPVLAAETEPIEMENPLGETSLSALIAKILKKVLGLTGVIAVIMFIYGGILWMTSGGNPEQVKKGRDTLLWAVIGLAFIFFAYSLLHFILKSLLEIT